MLDAARSWATQASASESVGAFAIGGGVVILIGVAVLLVLHCFRECTAAQRRALRDDVERPLTVCGTTDRRWRVFGRAAGRRFRYSLLPVAAV